MVLRIPLVTPSLLGPNRPAAPRLRPLGLRTGARIGWTCIRCDARLVASFGPAPACGCGGVVRPTTTS
jgi:hypothetical protein